MSTVRIRAMEGRRTRFTVGAYVRCDQCREKASERGICQGEEMTKIHPGKKQDCPRCRETLLGLDACFRLIAPKKKEGTNVRTDRTTE